MWEKPRGEKPTMYCMLCARASLGAYPGFSVERVDADRGARARKDAVSEEQHRQLPLSARLQADSCVSVQHPRIRIFTVHNEN